VRQLCGGNIAIGSGANIAAAVRFGNLLLLSGRTAALSSPLTMPIPNFDTQARLILDETFALLRHVGSGPDSILRVECYLVRRKDFDAWNRIWAEYFPTEPPARTTVVADLVLPGRLLELQVTAVAGPVS
jgi:2-iminobutanoate/2-iminopropanoate deaminase